jgi:hypothetical protein
MPAETPPHLYTHAPETLRPGTLLSGAVTPAERQNPYAKSLRELLDDADSNRDGTVTEAQARAELQRRIYPTR